MNINEIAKKEAVIDNCIKTLKQEFIGIDKIIDQVMNNVKLWYMFPKFNERPLVINLWGMTGCGKTSLVNRICDLLDIGNDLVYYNLAKLGEENSSEIEYNFNRLLGYKIKAPVFVFDEFQFAASIDSTGKEKEAKTSLKTIWEIIDTGKIYREANNYVKKGLKRIMSAFGILDTFEAKIENGIWVNSQECFDKMSVEQKTEIVSFFNMNFEINEIYKELKPSRYWCENLGNSVINNSEHYVSCEIAGILYDCSYSLGEHDYTYEEYFNKEIATKDLNQMIDYVVRIHKESCKGFYSDYSKALVFVMGNIDEAYTMSYNVNPDMDPDQFRAITEKLTVIDIREALQERFRNEQIARLGSIQILYPSFSKDNFEKIIEMSLDNYVKSVYDEIGINLHFDRSIKEMIYKDGVFPTQGTRPVFTSVYEIAKTKLANIVTECINRKTYDIVDIYFDAKDDVVNARCCNIKDDFFDMSFKQTLRLDGLRTQVKKEQQALTAVHESGHFVIYAKLTGKMPAKLVSVTASSNATGFMMPDAEDSENYMTFQDAMNDICVDLAGYAAELLVFGEDNLTSGASFDLRHATVHASNIIRDFGMLYSLERGNIGVTTYLSDPDSTDGGGIIHESDHELEITNKKINNILNTAVDEVKKILSEGEWHDMFLKSCEYLKDNPSMPKEKMIELYNVVSEEAKKEELREDTFFIDTLNKYIINK